MRLEPVADRIIQMSEATFLQGRNIMNNVLALHEILHETERRGQVGVVLKLDFEKAYDKVQWGFLIQCFQAMGFSRTWFSWIQMVLENGTVAVKVNNQIGPYFQRCKGIEQEDPLSP
jgi:hypothetical protein